MNNNTNNSFTYDFFNDTQSQIILENRLWMYTFSPEQVTLRWVTPFGGEYDFEVSRDNALSEITLEAESFDVDEYVKLWINGLGKNGVPDTVKELLEEAEAIKTELQELQRQLNLTEKDFYRIGNIGDLYILRENTKNEFWVCRDDSDDVRVVLDREKELRTCLQNIIDFFLGLI